MLFWGNVGCIRQSPLQCNKGLQKLLLLILLLLTRYNYVVVNSLATLMTITDPLQVCT